jgi:hypothetical protein
VDLARIAQELKSAQDDARQVEPVTARFPGFGVLAGQPASPPSAPAKS